MLPAALYGAIHVIEGETVTPMLLARQFTLNPVLVIFSFVFWFWLWGVPGAMGELRDRGLGLAADALAKSAEHIGSFFRMLQTELAFYVGCLNLHERLLELGAPFTFPAATEAHTPRLLVQGPLRRLPCADRRASGRSATTSARTARA